MKRLAIFGAVFLSACASNPENIAKTYISPLQYSQYDCRQISQELANVNNRATDLKAALGQKADNDAAQMGVGLILFWPTLFFLEGGDGPEAAEYARLKGQRVALDQAAIQKRCADGSVQRPSWQSDPRYYSNGYQTPSKSWGTPSKLNNPTPRYSYGNQVPTYRPYPPNPYNAPPPTYGTGTPQGSSGNTLDEILGN